MSYTKFNIRKDLRGSLIPIDSYYNLPFDIKRVFYIKDLDNMERGFHAHRKCEQVLVAIQGSFTLCLDDSEKITEYKLNQPNLGVYFPLYHWLVMKNFTKDCIIMVLCSYEFDEGEYIRDYEMFKKEAYEYKNSTRIQNFSLSLQTKKIKQKVIKKIENIIDDTSFVMGKDVSEFETKFSEFNNSKYCIGVSNGCSALKIAINSLQLKNPKVLIQANTYVAVPLVCEELKIQYEIIDIDNNLLLDLNKLESHLNLENSHHDIIVVIVHLYGNCVDMNQLMNLKNKYNFKLIEDAAQAHGSTFNGKKLGSFGDLGCFSFYPSKNLGAMGEAGAIVTNNYDYDKFCRLYRNYGSVERYKWEITGGNERMDNIQGGILSVKLDHLEDWNNSRRKLAQVYYNNLLENDNFRILKSINNCKSNYHLFIVLVDNRDELKEYLENDNIGCAIHYPKPFYESAAYKHLKIENCKVMENLKDKLLSLPMYPELTKNEVEKVCDKINLFYK